MGAVSQQALLVLLKNLNKQIVKKMLQIQILFTVFFDA